MVSQGADPNTQYHHQDRCGYIGGQRQRQWREEPGAPPGACQQHSLPRQQPCALLPPTADKVQNACRAAGGNFAAVNVEEALASIWALEEVDPAFDGGGTLPVAALLCRKTEEVLLEIQRDQRHPQQCRSFDSANCQPATGAMPRENSKKSEVGQDGGLGSLSFAAQHLNQYPLHHQQQHSQFGNGIPSFAMASERRGYGHAIVVGNGNCHNTPTANGVYHESDCLQQQQGGVDVLLAVDGSGTGGKASSNHCNGGLGFGGGGDGAEGMAGGHTGAGSPKSSISSDGSGGDLVDHSPASVWEVDMRRGASRGGGSGGGGRKRTLNGADETVAGSWQLQAISTTSESLARFRDDEQSMDGLRQLFLCANVELGSTQASTAEEIRKKEENVRSLLQILRVTSLERDEAREQLQKLLNKIAPPNPVESYPIHLRHDLLFTGRARDNSTVTEFDSLSQTHNYQPPYVSSPAKSLFDPLSSPELPNKSVADSSNTAVAPQPPLPGCISSMPPGLGPGSPELDPASAIIDRLVAKKALPEKGKLLQAVMEAGPLLQTLLVAGSLPRWRNPPPPLPFQIPPVSVRARGPGVLNQNAVLNQDCAVQGTPRAFHHQNPLVASWVYGAPSLGSSGLGSFCLRGPMPSTCASSYQGSLGKRQKL